MGERRSDPGPAAGLPSSAMFAIALAASALVMSASTGSAVAAPRAASTGHPGSERLRLTAVGRAAAGDAVLHADDLSGAHWIGGLVEPQASPREELPCAGRGIFDPRESDIVVAGMAESDYRVDGFVDVDTSAQVVQTPTMAKNGWERWAQRGFVRCWRAEIASPGTVVSSVERVPFPHMGSFSAEYRAVYGPYPGPFEEVDDTILIAAACTRLRLTVSSYRSAEPQVAKIERRLAAIVTRAAAAGSCSTVA